MKKIFCVMALFSALVVSCNRGSSSDKPEDKKVVTNIVGDYGSFEEMVTPLGGGAPQMKLGLMKGDSVLIEPEFDKIAWDKELKGFLCYTGDKFTIADTKGKVLRYGEYVKITLDGDFYNFLNEDGKKATYCNSTGNSWGMYEEIVIDEFFVFCQKGSKWGISSLDNKLSLEKEYDNIYVVNFKDKNSYNVFLNKNGKWEMIDQANSYYDTPSADIKRMVNGKKPKKPVGVVNITF